VDTGMSRLGMRADPAAIVEGVLAATCPRWRVS
jgi:hypothetical protein